MSIHCRGHLLRGLLLSLFALTPHAWCGEEGKAPIDRPVAPKAKPVAPKSAPAKSYAEARADFDAVAKSCDAGVLTTALTELVRAAVKDKDPKHAKSVRKVLKQLLKHKDERVVAAALQGYGSLALPKTSSDFKRFVHKKRSRRLSLQLRKEAIKAWARVGDRGGHEVLLDYIKLPSTDAGLIELALLSATEVRRFSGKTSKAHAGIIDDFMKAYAAIHSAGIGSFMASTVAAAWWDKLKDAMLATFNELADRKCEDYPSCRDWWREARRAWR